MITPNFEVRNEKAEKMLREIGEMLREACPPGFGFALLVFTFEPGAMFYAANGDREGVIRAMEEFIAKHREN